MTTTTAATLSSARCGTWYVGCTASSHRGRSPSRAMARLVRPRPATRASSAPAAASAAPTRTTGPAQSQPVAATASASGSVEAPVASGPSTASTATPTTAYTTTAPARATDDGARDDAGRVADLLAEGGDPRVPGEREEQQTRRLQQPVGAVRESQSVEAPALPPPAQRRDGDRERDQDQCDDDPRQPGGPGDARAVDQREDDDHRGGDGLLPAVGGGVRRERHRHRRAARGLADHEAPAGQEAPPLAEHLAAVEVGAAGARVRRRELRAGRRVAVGDDGRDREAGEQPGTRGAGRRRERREHARADHRAQPDHHGVAEAEPPASRPCRSRCHPSTLVNVRRPWRRRSSRRPPRSLSRREAVLPDRQERAGHVHPPSGRGTNQRWKCAPSPQRYSGPGPPSRDRALHPAATAPSVAALLGMSARSRSAPCSSAREPPARSAGLCRLHGRRPRCVSRRRRAREARLPPSSPRRARERQLSRFSGSAVPGTGVSCLQPVAGTCLIDVADRGRGAQAGTTRVCSRPGPTPTPQMRVPDISSSVRT